MHAVAQMEEEEEEEDKSRKRVHSSMTSSPGERSSVNRAKSESQGLGTD